MAQEIVQLIGLEIAEIENSLKTSENRNDCRDK